MLKVFPQGPNESVVALSGQEHRTQAPLYLISRVWVRIPIVTLVSLSETLNQCFILRMGCKAVGPVYCYKNYQRM